MTFVPAHRFVGDRNAEHWALVLHGALGSAQNWVSFAKNLAERTPRIAYLLVDIRGHGASLDAPPPHGLTAAANDLVALANDVGQAPRVVMGHSLGGKLALEYARTHPGQLEQVWCLDANPAAQPNADASHDVFRVLEHVQAVGQPHDSRQGVIEVLEKRGLSTSIARWLGTSLRKDVGGYFWTYDFDCLSELLADYFSTDLWDYVRSPRGRPTVHLVVAERSAAWTPGFHERVQALTPSQGLVPHLLPDSGHWVHVDNPRGLLAMMVPELLKIGSA